jgi:acetyl-CoA acetyltransferase
MSGLFAARNKVAIVGFAQSPAVRRPSEPLGVTAVRTARAAIADAGLTPEQIDGFISATLMPSSGGQEAQDGVSIVTSNWLAKHLGVQPRYAAGFQGVGQITGSLSLAIGALASGAADYVLLHRALHNPPGKYNDNPMTEIRGDQQWTAPQGFFGSLPAIAMAYNEYCQRYGATREAMAQVVVEARRNGANNPWSHWRGKPITVEDYLAEPLIVDPMSRLDCDIPVENVGVLILTTAERAKDLPNKPVTIAGYAMGYPRQHRLPLHWTLGEMMEAGFDLAGRLWEATGVTARDIDVPQFYDAFSPFVYVWLESLGFCPEGEAHRFVLDGGIDSRRPGSLPVLCGGGAIGNGRLHGLPQVLEVYLQLAGRSGERQREAAIGLSSYSSPHYGGAFVFTNDPQAMG